MLLKSLTRPLSVFEPHLLVNTHNCNGLTAKGNMAASPIAHTWHKVFAVDDNLSIESELEDSDISAFVSPAAMIFYHSFPRFSFITRFLTETILSLMFIIKLSICSFRHPSI